MIMIHGKQYVTVAERVLAAHDECDQISITTECIGHNPVLFKATVVTKKGTFTGWSAADPLKPIEKRSPYEVSETSAVGRALSFAGYGQVDSLASADEIIKADVGYSTDNKLTTYQITKLNSAYKQGYVLPEEMKTVLQLTVNQANDLIKKAEARYIDEKEKKQALGVTNV